MTMNMPPPYQQSPHYLQQPYQGSNSMPSTSNFNAQYNRQNLAPTSPNQLHPSMMPQQVNRNQSPVNVAGYSSQNAGRGTNVSGDSFSTPSFGPGGYQNMPRENNFMRMSEGNQQSYVSPMRQPMHPQQQQFAQQQQQFQQQNYHQRPQNHYNPQPPYQQTPYQYYPQQQSYQQPPYNQQPQHYIPQQPYSQQQHYPQQQSYPQQQPYPQQQSYIPIYAQLYQSLQQNMPKNLPDQSLNSNFSYQNANFNCDYSVEENMVHCVICNQTYKANQRKQHLELHREKARNVNIRPVDEQQLKRLQKYNSMNKRGIIVKPIVQPDEFNVQYNPNEFVLRKVTQYKDINAPNKNQIQIQTEDPHQNLFERPQDLGYQQPRRSGHSGHSSPDRRSQPSMRRSESPAVVENPRNTNTRFQSQSIRQEEEIFLSDRFDHQEEGEALKSNYNANDPSFRESERKSINSQKLGSEQSSNLNYRVTQSVDRAEDLGYEKGSVLHDIYEADEDLHQSDIPIQKITNQVLRDSQY